MISKNAQLAQLFIDHCYKDDKPVVCTPMFKTEYEFGEVKVKFSQDILDEIIKSEKVKVSNQNDKQVTLMGI